jgi:hypothetical protein
VRQSLDVFILAQELEGEKALMNENIKHLEGLRDNMELNISDKEGGKVCILSLGKIFVTSLFLCLVSLLFLHFTLMRIRILLVPSMQMRIWPLFTLKRIRILASKKRLGPLKKARIGSYSTHFGLSSAN